MKRQVVTWKISEIYYKREQISFPEYQREPKLWSTKDKQLLIDSILNDIDIPKFYFYKVGKDEYEVVDGQQRLWAIWEFIDNEYTCKIGGKNRTFEELPEQIRQKIMSYGLQITIITEASDEYLRKLFLRLQLGLLLNTGEKLHALVGSMRDFVFKKMVKHVFIQNISIPKRRYARQTLCAQICINSFNIAKNGEFSRTRYDDLEYFFKDYASIEGTEFKLFERRCKHIIAVLDTLYEHFGADAKKLKNRSFTLSAYLLTEEFFETLQKSEIIKVIPKFVEFMIYFWIRLKEETKAGFDRKNKELYLFESYLSNAPGEKYQVERRHKKLKEFFKYFTNKGIIKGDKNFPVRKPIKLK